jgi:hypothetical protein
MVKTAPSAVQQDLRTDEEKAFDASVRGYATIPEPVNEADNPNALFANGWGRRGHFALLVAPSGVGKSVISTQLLVPWAMGRPALVGSAPLMPLRISLIQAEDDDTEMAEFRRDHRLGHVAEGWTLDEVLEAEKKVSDWSPFFCGKVGNEFLRGLDFALRRQPMDVVIMNPLQSYTEIDLNKNKEITEFLRNGIDPLIAKHRVFLLCVHHTNKPQIDKSKGGAFGEDSMAAYVGAGGAELTNYSRSVTFIRRCSPKECAIENSFMLIGAKRGNRLGWKDADGKKTNRRIIAYSEDYIHWRIPTPEEIEAAAGGGANVGLTPEAAADMIADAILAEWPKKGIVNFCRDRLCDQMTRAEFKAGWERFDFNHTGYGMRKVFDGRGAYHFEPATDAEQETQHDEQSELWYNKE